MFFLLTGYLCLNWVKLVNFPKQKFWNPAESLQPGPLFSDKALSFGEYKRPLYGNFIIIIIKTGTFKCYPSYDACLGKFCSFLFPGLKSTSTKNLLWKKWQLITNNYPSVSGSVAEWSKALVLGTSLFGGVGSNPTAAKFPFFIISSSIEYSIRYCNFFIID